MRGAILFVLNYVYRTQTLLSLSVAVNGLHSYTVFPLRQGHPISAKAFTGCFLSITLIKLNEFRPAALIILHHMYVPQRFAAKSAL